MKRFLKSLALALFSAANISAQTPEVQSALKRYNEFRPEKNELAMYQIDWAISLQAAQDKALKENRPVFLVIIHAQYGDLDSGHC
ncbi:MAG: hypothetical protein GY899_07145 [Verrucomicrobiaceae bacterium]|nr:hypothetical protein [Verrucomicrobiaceae bacterium]